MKSVSVVNSHFPIILGSKSFGRRLVLKKAGYKFRVVASGLDEKAIRDKIPQKLVLKLAKAKADAIMKKNRFQTRALLITADQVVVYRGKIREKPKSKKQAEEFIRSYQFYPMETVSSVVVTNTSTGKRAAGVHISKVYFKTIPDKVIKLAIARGRVMHCAGAMRCEEPPFNRYVKRLVGSLDSTSGMPLELLGRLLKQAQNLSIKLRQNYHTL